MSSGNYYYDPVTNWQLDWSNIYYYKKLFKTNCMSRFIDRGFKKLMIDNMDIDLEIMELNMKTRITEKVRNNLLDESDKLCNNLDQLKIDYDEIKNMLNDL